MKRIMVNDPLALPTALRALHDGFLIIYPTDTAYAIGADAQNERAVRTVQQAKQREEAKPLPLIAADLVQVESVAVLQPEERKMAQKKWPGPLSLLLERLAVLPEAVTLGLSRVAIRVPQAPFARELARRLGHPLVATSANAAGSGAKYDPDEIVREMPKGMHQPVLCIDAGVLPKIKPSTLAEFRNGIWHVLRQGPVVLH